MTDLSELKFFKTPPHECSYLPEVEATTLFVDPGAEIDTATYTALSALGFRRSGDHIYRPYCANCQACIPVRIPVHQFRLSRSQKRVLKKNQDLVVKAQTPYFSVDYYQLYESYINQRHADGDMFPASEEQFHSFLVDGRKEAMFFEMTCDGQLLGISVADQLNDGLSAIYTFFAPEQASRSLGKFAVLWLVEEAKRRGLPYVYLGYWIQACQKMSYKADYKPLQMFLENQWLTFFEE